MKKTISLSLVFSFLMALAIQMPALAVDTPTSTPPVVPPASTSSPSYVPPVPTNYPVPTAGTSSIPVYVSPTAPTSSIPALYPPVPTPTAYTPEVTASSTSEDKPMLISYPPVPNGTSTDVKKPEPVKIDTSKLDKRLEKIAHPDQVKLFEKITKIGNALYGVRKSTSTPATTDIKKPVATASAQNLEKIASPDQIKLYEKITKIGNSLYGIKKKIVAAIDNIKQEVKKMTSSVLPTLTPDLITCAGTAIDTKDSKISDAVTASATDIAAAITARGTCQKAALALNSEQNGALAKCNQDFQAATKAANEKVRSTQKAVWDAYTNDLKTCSTNASTTEIKIEDGGQNTSDALVQ